MTLNLRLPYPGLRAYAHDETDLFFGREDCINEMIDRLAATHFLAVLGASGSGKSSLVRTGLQDALELGLYAAAGPDWAIADCHPGGSAIHNLAIALLLAGRHDATPLSVATLESFLRRGPRSIVEWVNDGNLPPKQNLLILVDQFEELFRYSDYAGREEAEAFSSALLESTRSHGQIHVVITMRSEYLGACALLPGLAEQINTSIYLARRMTRQECREAIEGPAGVIGFDIEPELVAQLLNDLAALAPWETDREHSQLQRLSRQADQLPLMQHALSRLWQLAERRPRSGRLVLTLQDYLDIGKLSGALDQHAGEVIEHLSDTAKPVVRFLFRSLVSGSSLADAVRKPMRLAELCDATSADKAAIHEVIEAFRSHDCNFLRPSEVVTLTDDTIVDISHESLIRQWNRLAEWFQEEARSSSLWTRLISDQERYAAGQGELLSGLGLANTLAWWEAESPSRGWALSHGGRFAEVEGYLRQSRENEEEHTREHQQRLLRERRWLRIRAASYAGLALVSMAFAVWATYSGAKATRAKSDLLASYEELNRARHIVQQERDSAREALTAKENADERALAATDRFVVGLARRLLVTPGISSDQVETQLSEGKKYLDAFADHTANERRIALIRAKFSLVTAQIYQDRGEFERSVNFASDTRRLLMDSLGSDPPSRDERLQLLEVGIIIAQNLYAMKRYPQALAEAKDLAANVDGMAVDPEVLLEKGKVYVTLSMALWATNNYADALDSARAALAILSQSDIGESVEVRDYRARCHTNLAVIDWSLGKLNDVKAEEVLAEQAFSAIPLDMKTVPMLLAHSQALSNLALDHLNNKDLRTAKELYEKSESILTLSELDIRQRVALRRALVDRRNSLGYVSAQLGDETAAVAWYQKAVDLGLMDMKWRQDPELASNLDQALASLIDAVSDLDWDTNKTLVLQSERATRDRLTVLHWLIANHLQSDPCVGCELDLQRIRLFALTQFDLKLGEDRHADAMTVADEIIAGAKAILANPETELHAVVARRVWFQSLTYLGTDTDSFPSARTREEQLARLDDTMHRQRDFLAAFPGAWRVERLLGQAEGNRAKLLADLGKKQEAVAAAAAGAAAFDKSSVELLESWYRTGSGPIERDLVKAATYQKLLANRVWGTRTVTVQAKRAWIEKDEPAKYSLVVEDRLRDDDDVVGRAIWQYRIVEGMELSESLQQYLRTIMEAAQQRNVGFIGQLLLDIGDSETVGSDLTSVLRQRLTAHDTVHISEEISARWQKGNSAEAIQAALNGLLKDQPDPAYVDDLYNAALNLAGDENYRPAEIVLSTLADIKDLPPNRMAAILGARGKVRQNLKEFNAAEADLSLALVLKPDDPQLLNAEAYVWVTHGQHLPTALKLLERAVQLDPKDPEIRDSLGWAYVIEGSTEKGLALVKSASDERPELSEIYAHLADIYRRLGRKTEARAALTHAAILPMNEDVMALYQRVDKLLDDETNRPVLSDNMMLAVSARIMATTNKANRTPYSADDAGIAVRGYDVVSYFEAGRPEKGSIQFPALWDDTLWLFTSAEHRAQFKKSPFKFIPAYGGYCALQFANHRKVHGDPLIWVVQNNKLYFFESPASRAAWLSDSAKNTKAADAVFDTLVEVAVEGDVNSDYSNGLTLMERRATK